MLKGIYVSKHMNFLISIGGMPFRFSIVETECIFNPLICSLCLLELIGITDPWSRLSSLY